MSGTGGALQEVSNGDMHRIGLSTDVELFDFQLEYISWAMSALEDGWPNLLCGDEMGLGKTFEAGTWDLYLRKHHAHPGKMKTLVIAPLSVLPAWKQWFEEHTDLRVRMVDRKHRHDLLDEEADVYCLHWDVLRLMPELREVKWFHIIADEVHKAKNRKTKQTRALKRLKSNFKTGASGTPMVNRPDELWSLVDWLYPGKFGGYWNFYNRFVDFEIIYPQGFHKVIGCRSPERLRELLAPFFIRRKKMDVLEDLPDKYYTDVWVDLEPKQKRAYDSMAKDMLAWIGENEDNPLVAPVVIARLIRLQQLALSYGDLVYNERRDEYNYFPSMPSAKIEALRDILEDTEGPVVVFSQFSKMIDLVEQQLRKPKPGQKAYTTVKLTGSVPTEKRQKNIEAFQRGEAQVFLATIGAGGVGITLTAASTAIFLDRSWSPADNLQAEDRLHRIGQKNAVQIIDIMARGTVDLGRRQKLELKWSWIKQILG